MVPAANAGHGQAGPSLSGGTDMRAVNLELALQACLIPGQRLPWLLARLERTGRSCGRAS